MLYTLCYKSKTNESCRSWNIFILSFIFVIRKHQKTKFGTAKACLYTIWHSESNSNFQTKSSCFLNQKKVKTKKKKPLIEYQNIMIFKIYLFRLILLFAIYGELFIGIKNLFSNCVLEMIDFYCFARDLDLQDSICLSQCLLVCLLLHNETSFMP